MNYKQQWMVEDLSEINEYTRGIKHYNHRLACRTLEKNKPMVKTIKEVIQAYSTHRKLIRQRMIADYGVQTVQRVCKRHLDKDGKQGQGTRPTNNIFTKPKR